MQTFDVIPPNSLQTGDFIAIYPFSTMVIEKMELLTANLPDTILFYEGVLGMQVLKADDNSASFVAGKTILCFLRAEMQQPVYHFALTIPSNKLDEAYQLMSSRLDILDVPPSGKIADFSNWNAEAFYFYDNNGNIVEFIARHDINNQIEETFTGSSIYAVSEIGLVTEDVNSLLEEINKRFGFPLYAKQPPQQRFAVMGDDEGLLIVVEKERPWFPTGVKAAAFPVYLEMAGSSGAKINMRYPFK